MPLLTLSITVVPLNMLRPSQQLVRRPRKRRFLMPHLYPSLAHTAGKEERNVFVEGTRKCHPNGQFKVTHSIFSSSFCHNTRLCLIYHFLLTAILLVSFSLSMPWFVRLKLLESLAIIAYSYCYPYLS